MHRRISITLTSIVLLLVAVVACGPELSPEEQVAELRSQYTAEINGMAIQTTPEEAAAGEEAEGEEAAEGEAAPDEAAEGEGEEAGPEGVEEVEAQQDVILDILVTKEGRGESLSLLTVDVEQVDAEENVKQTWKVYLDVSEVLRGPGTQITHRLEEGDGFFAQVRHPVPPEERSDYREFQEHGSEG